MHIQLGRHVLNKVQSSELISEGKQLQTAEQRTFWTEYCDMTIKASTWTSRHVRISIKTLRNKGVKFIKSSKEKMPNRREMFENLDRNGVFPVWNRSLLVWLVSSEKGSNEEAASSSPGRICLTCTQQATTIQVQGLHTHLYHQRAFNVQIYSCGTGQDDSIGIWSFKDDYFYDDRTVINTKEHCTGALACYVHSIRF